MIATRFALTDEERTRREAEGPHPEYVNETAWALVDLQKDGLIKRPTRNSSSIALRSPEDTPTNDGLLERRYRPGGLRRLRPK